MELSNLPPEMAEQITRMHHRMQEWRTKNPSADVLILWKEKPGTTIICDIRTAIKVGLVHTNDPGFEMIRSMCEPEECIPTISMVREAIEL